MLTEAFPSCRRQAGPAANAVRLNGVMRIVISVTVVVVLASILTGCGILDGGPKVPKDETWRQDVVTVLEETPGVTSAEVSVNEVDDGGGGKGPVIYGTLTVTGDAQSVVDNAMRRVSDVLGPDSSGVGLNLSISSSEAPGQNLRDFGYGDTRHGRALWEMTH